MEDLSLNEGQTFSEFKDKFYARFPDLSVFDCGDFNALKIVLDGLTVGYSQGRLKSKFMSKPLWLLNLRNLFLNALNADKPFEEIRRNINLLIVGSHQTICVGDGQYRLTYFERILQSEKHKNPLIVVNRPPENKVDYDLDMENLYAEGRRFRWYSEEILLLKDLRTLYKSLQKYFTQSDLNRISLAFENFFHQYVSWNHLLRKLPDVSLCYLTTHYHREGFIYALRKHRIHCIELQHGLISEEDIYYSFPADVLGNEETFLLCDEIYTLGTDWNRVLEIGNVYSRIKAIGDYRTTYGGELVEKTNNKIILIASQTKIREVLWEYAIFLSDLCLEKYRDVDIWYKPHPVEYGNLDFYSSASNRSNLHLKTENIQALLPNTDAQVSVYSTTLIEGLKFGVPSFSLNYPEAKDYIDKFVTQNISVRIEREEFPLNIENNCSAKNRFFEPFKNLPQIGIL